MPEWRRIGSSLRAPSSSQSRRRRSGHEREEEEEGDPWRDLELEQARRERRSR